ncbi:MAG: serine/threonine-protein phosphatase [Clostridiales Family XIII bacterium]|jgi:sigma-B regulation protein RsbU (phosphoserine phosphatase)|nr:serine/threonine-protein phosphatase [Clostridiales Family XIII bacterium]
MSGQLAAIKAVLGKFPMSAWLIDADETIVYMNREMQDLFGDLSGRKTDLVYGGAAAARADMEKAGFAEVALADVPFRLIGNDVELDGEGRYRIELFEDISEKKHMQDSLVLNLAKVKAETTVAKSIQHSILPVDDTYWNTIAFSSVYLPADDLGGDFFDILRINEDEFLLYMADVSGHGIQASLLTIFMQGRVRANADTASEGIDILLGKLLKDFCALEISGMIYLTMILCKYNRKRKELSIANAGHNCFPLIMRQSGHSETIPIKGMPICTISDEDSYEEEIVSMNPGDRLILYTDGIIEEVDPVRKRAFGQEGVREIAEKCQDYSGAYLARAIIEASSKYTLLTAKDDRTILVADILA